MCAQHGHNLTGESPEYGLIVPSKMEFDNVSPAVLYFAFILCLLFFGFLSAVCLVCGIKAFKKPNHRMIHHKKEINRLDLIKELISGLTLLLYLLYILFFYRHIHTKFNRYFLTS